MGSGEDEADDSDGAESSAPSISDLAKEIEEGAGSSPRPEDVGGSPEDDEPPSSPSFADMASSIRQGRSVSADVSDLDESTAGEAPHPEAPLGRSDVRGGQDDWGWRQAGSKPADGMFESTAKTDALLELVSDSANILLLGELLHPEEYDVCTKLLGAKDPVNLLLVTFTQSPDERLNVCRGYLGELPGETTVVSVGEPVRSGSSSSMMTDGSGGITVETVADPTDLMRIGITISRKLSELEATGVPTVICFHSVTALLQFVDDRRTVFRFLHTLRGRVRAAGARAHYHLDSGAHEEELVTLLRPLFDVTLRIEDDGDLSVERHQ